MKREYIRTEEMERLLILVPDLENMKLSLKAELEKLQAFEKDMDSDYIESATFGSFKLSDMPIANVNNTSDKTADVAMSYQKHMTNEAKEAKKAIKEVTREIYYIEVILDKIEIGLKALSETHREVLELKYWQNYSWNEILKVLENSKCIYSKTHVQRIVKKIIIKLRAITMIDMQGYKNVMSLVEKSNN